MTAAIEPLSDGDAAVEQLVAIINAAYALGEAGLWSEGWQRTDAQEIAAATRTGGMLGATRDGRLVGSAYVRPLDAGTADLGLVAVAPEHWGGGVGRELVRAAETLAASRGMKTMQLELLVPKAWRHPEKERLREWYTRLVYRVVGSARFEDVAVHLASQLATPCEFVVFRKSLADLSASADPSCATIATCRRGSIPPSDLSREQVVKAVLRGARLTSWWRRSRSWPFCAPAASPRRELVAARFRAYRPG